MAFQNSTKVLFVAVAQHDESKDGLLWKAPFRAGARLAPERAPVRRNSKPKKKIVMTMGVRPEHEKIRLISQ